MEKERAIMTDISDMPEDFADLVKKHNCRSFEDFLRVWLLYKGIGGRWTIAKAIAEVIPNLLRWQAQQLEDAPGPRANQEEVSALRQRMDGLAETLEKMQPIDTSDVLERLVQDVALMKDSIVLTYTPDGYEKARQFRNTYIGTKPQTPEARKTLGVYVATPEPTYKWVGNEYYYLNRPIGGVSQLWNGTWLPSCSLVLFRDTIPCTTEAEARAWVEAQFNPPKQ